MKLDVTKKIAHLSRLKLSDAELENYTEDLSKIIDYVGQLSEVNTDSVDPITHGIPLESHQRKDEAQQLDPEETKKLIDCSEDSLYEQFKVPQVIGGGE